jgi:hypothetical protein
MVHGAWCMVHGVIDDPTDSIFATAQAMAVAVLNALDDHTLRAAT